MNDRMINYCLNYLMSTSQVVDLALFLGKSVRGKNKEDLVLKVRRELPALSIEEIRKYCLGKWIRPDTALHKQILKSGVLKGHSWHGATPARLHQSFQDKVREVSKGSLRMEELLKIGADIVKHEYFMVATADLCENLIITKFDAVPSIISRGVSDFVFKGVPYDLKNTPVPGEWTSDQAKNDKSGIISSLIMGADTERMRLQAQKSNESWTSNRFFIITENSEEWLEDPDKVLDRLEKEVSVLGEPIELEVVPGVRILCQAVFI